MSGWMEKAMDIEDDVWQVNMVNQVDRLGKTLDFPAENGVPSRFKRYLGRPCSI